MKDIKLESFQEMEENEMVKCNGGLGLLSVVAIYVALEIAGSPNAHWQAFKRGWDAG